MTTSGQDKVSSSRPFACDTKEDRRDAGRVETSQLCLIPTDVCPTRLRVFSVSHIGSVSSEMSARSLCRGIPSSFSSSHYISVPVLSCVCSSVLV